MEKLGAATDQMSAAMQQMQQQMANMPPQQRAMMDKMMKGKMPGMPSQALPTLRVESGGRGKWGSYSCKKYTIFLGAEKKQELCAASIHDVEGAKEAVQALRNLQGFYQKIRKSLQKMPGFGSMNQNAVEVMGKIDGFPVFRREFSNGVVEREVYLSSAKSKGLSNNIFLPPKGFKEGEFMPGSR